MITMAELITLCNSDREPYYTLSIDKMIGKYSIYFPMTISNGIVINLSIYELVSMQNYLYCFDNSDTLLEPLELVLSPTNKYTQGYMTLEPYTDYAHAMWYEGMELYISIDNQIFKGFIELEEISKFYTLLQYLITTRGNTQ